MTMNFLIEEFESKPFVNFNNQNIKIKLDWVSHGNFSVHTDDDYLTLEWNHFQEVLDTFENAPKNTLLGWQDSSTGNELAIFGRSLRL
jgi:hypothetical protein